MAPWGSGPTVPRRSQRRSEIEEQGARRIALGATLALLGGALALVLPTTAIYLSSFAPTGLFSLAPNLFRLLGACVVGGALLFVAAFFLYRRGFAALRKVEGEFALASAFCLVGSVGFVLLLAMGLSLLGSSDSVVGCLHGQPTRALRCFAAAEPLGAGAGILGFVLGWVGGVGIVVGLWFVGARLGEPAVRAGALVYLALLAIVAAPFAVFATPFAGAQFLLLLVPVLTVAAPGLVLAGTVPRVVNAEGGI